MKPVDVKANTYIDTSKEINDKDPKFKIGDFVRISTCENIFAKSQTSNWSEEVFLIKKVKNTILLTIVIDDLNGEEIVGRFYEKNCKNKFRIEKVIQKKGDKLYFKWKVYNIVCLIAGLIKKIINE